MCCNLDFGFNFNCLMSLHNTISLMDIDCWFNPADFNLLFALSLSLSHSISFPRPNYYHVPILFSFYPHHMCGAIIWHPGDRVHLHRSVHLVVLSILADLSMRIPMPLTVAFHHSFISSIIVEPLFCHHKKESSHCLFSGECTVSHRLKSRRVKGFEICPLEILLNPFLLVVWEQIDWGQHSLNGNCTVLYSVCHSLYRNVHFPLSAGQNQG